MNFPQQQFQLEILAVLSKFRINECVIVAPLPQQDKHQEIICAHLAWNKDRVLKSMEQVKETADMTLKMLHAQEKLHI